MAEYIILRRMPSGVRGKFLYLYWDGRAFSAEGVAMRFPEEAKKDALALAKASCAGQRNIPYLQKTLDA